VAGDDGGAGTCNLVGSVAGQVVDRIGDGLLVERPQRVRFGVEPGLERLVQAGVLNRRVSGKRGSVRPGGTHRHQATPELVAAVGESDGAVTARCSGIGGVALAALMCPLAG